MYKRNVFSCLFLCLHRCTARENEGTQAHSLLIRPLWSLESLLYVLEKKRGAKRLMGVRISSCDHFNNHSLRVTKFDVHKSFLFFTSSLYVHILLLTKIPFSFAANNVFRQTSLQLYHVWMRFKFL